MAINHADGTLFFSVILYPIAAGVGAAHAGASWLTIFFVPIGLAIGAGIIYIGRKLVYFISEYGLDCISKMSKGWVRQVVTAPFFLLYVLLPLVIVWGGVYGIWSGSIWLVQHVR